ncbi:GMC oxidoreductase [Plenodomus tracheiphilus IPT5]|uniref:GMC oxidoreductase n=1 Tax=Plenodomus tracheiphilus IPT5 TaxID=1408161 RepID=A0A6A7BM57_9PLEO|nr:GMC oxidoreductase [Plenodomus tracheiphilus IPT5]
MASSYDFIIVGAGTAGCLLAHRLAHCPAKPTVLVLEAGGHPEGDFLHAPYHRYHPVALRPDLDHGHVSEPEPTLNDRQIVYTRGKGLGGSSILNFGVYLYGSSEYYNRWADLVGDDSWKWENVQKSYRAIENYEIEGAKGYAHLADPSRNQHSRDGKLKVGLPPVLEAGVVPQMEALIQAGEKINLDPNSGDPVGVSVFPFSYSKDGRSTSAGAHLLDPPGNLEVWTDASVEKLVWEGKKVVGVTTADGRAATAKKEVILCGGSIDTPKLLLLNGIGPKDELEALGIEVKSDLPGIGKHLQDHVLAFMTVEVDGSSNERYAFEGNQERVAKAEAAWKKDKSGAFALSHSCLWGGYLKLHDLQTMPEFKALPHDKQEFLSRDAVPTYEFINNCLLWPPGSHITEGNSYMTFIAFLMNPQSEGSVTLRSSNPADKPVIKLNYLTHPYDARIFREAIRSTWQKLVLNPTIAKSVVRTILGPASLSDEDVDAFARDNAGTVWHANGTVKMGKREDENACVDSGFRVRGVEGLRVVDLSVAPLTPNNHTQATAYLIGQVAAEKLGEEYGLNR